MQLIKNRTIYKGKLYLVFEKYPNYSGSTVLNKIHLNLGFTKLVSRLTKVQLKADRYKHSYEYNLDLLEK